MSDYAWQTPEVDRIAACMQRLVARYRRRPRGDDMPQWDRDQFRRWFEDRNRYLQQEYARAINEAGNIIGKQYHYDHTVVRLHDA